ncbi:MAG: hypothetical protein M0038_20265 [Pseudomonadota bacterium]|jgi:hypothetical protein|nr:hypothetical protein [Pseudomonadota bacterium]
MSANGTAFSREQLIAYLLEELPQPQLAAIDARLLSDEPFGVELEAMRVQLLDEYALGGQSAGERERWRRALQVSGDADPALAFARALPRQLERRAQSTPAPDPRGRFSLSPRRWGWAVPLAASVLLAFGFGGYWIARHGARRAPRQEAAGAYTLLLRPQRLRGVAGPNVVHVPLDVGSVQVQMVVPGRFALADVTVRSPDGHRRFTHLPIRVFEGVHFVQFALPVRRAHAGIYHFDLRTAGAPGPVAHYSVVLARP